MKTIIDIENWKRKEHFRFFKKFDEPFFNIVANVDCTNAYRYCKDNNISFFLFYLFQSTKAFNEIDEFRYRIDGDKVIDYKPIHASSTINRSDNTFAFSFFPYSENFAEFVHNAKSEIERVRNSRGLRLNDNVYGLDVIHYTVIPWISFTSVSHPRNYGQTDSIPKISFGRFFKQGNELMMPVSVDAHHSLVDGYHAGEYFRLFENMLNATI